MKRHRKILTGILVTLVAVCALLLGGGFFLLDYALKPEELQTRSRNIDSSYVHMYKEYPWIQPWADSLRATSVLRDTVITGKRGERLHALYAKAAQPTKRTAVIVHGYTDNAVRMLHIGHMYNLFMGYNILLPDLHAHGQSEGDAVQMGWLDRLDVLQWTETASDIFGDSTQIVVHGISMGAATAMMLSSEASLPASVKCIVEDCGYTSVWDEFSSELKNQFGLPPFPLLHIASQLCQWKYGWNFHEASALQQVKQCRLPMLFIHGDADTFVPTWMVHPLYEAKPEPKVLWTVPGSKHAASYRDEPDLYAGQVKKFTEKYLP